VAEDRYDDVVNRGGSFFIMGWEKAYGEFWAGRDYERVIGSTLPWIKRLWLNGGRVWTNQQDEDARVLVDDAYNTYLKNSGNSAKAHSQEAVPL
jgi:hypothetical protein